MKTFIRDYRITGDYPKVYADYFQGMKPCILDIETTGLDPSRCKVCLVALLVRTTDGVRVTQFLAENHYDEHRVLAATADFIKSEAIDYFITFNGQAFDLPFLRKRLSQNFIEDDFGIYHFDLYRFVIKGTDLRKRLPSISQKSLERYYGIGSDRKDVITGRESINMFSEYALTGDSTLEKIILTHNREDVVQLHRLMFRIPCEADDFDSAMADIGFPLLNGQYSVRPHISKAKSMLRICGEQLSAPVSAEFFPDMDSSIHAIFDSKSASFEIDVPVQSHGRDYFVDISKLGPISSADKLGDSLEPQSLAESLANDPDFINGYLILSTRSINLLSRHIIEHYANMLN